MSRELANADLQKVQVTSKGQALLEQPLLNKGTAFTEQERHELGLMGLLPPEIENIEQQLSRCYEAFAQQATDLEKHIYLRNLQDENETLFYRLILDHIAEMLPIIYTPVVGEACQNFSHIYRRPRGLFISYPEREHVDEILANCGLAKVEVIVVTDGERILGLGDRDRTVSGTVLPSKCPKFA
jgi:malate dehydrogenase (oxaloacetate-decarboxylating)